MATIGFTPAELETSFAILPLNEETVYSQATFLDALRNIPDEDLPKVGPSLRLYRDTFAHVGIKAKGFGRRVDNLLAGGQLNKKGLLRTLAGTLSGVGEGSTEWANFRQIAVTKARVALKLGQPEAMAIQRKILLPTEIRNHAIGGIVLSDQRGLRILIEVHLDAEGFDIGGIATYGDHQRLIIHLPIKSDQQNLAGNMNKALRLFLARILIDYWTKLEEAQTPIEKRKLNDSARKMAGRIGIASGEGHLKITEDETVISRKSITLPPDVDLLRTLDLFNALGPRRISRATNREYHGLVASADRGMAVAETTFEKLLSLAAEGGLTLGDKELTGIKTKKERVARIHGKIREMWRGQYFTFEEEKELIPLLSDFERKLAYFYKEAERISKLPFVTIRNAKRIIHEASETFDDLANQAYELLLLYKRKLVPLMDGRSETKTEADEELDVEALLAEVDELEEGESEGEEEIEFTTLEADPQNIGDAVSELEAMIDDYQGLLDEMPGKHDLEIEDLEAYAARVKPIVENREKIKEQIRNITVAIHEVLAGKEGILDVLEPGLTESLPEKYRSLIPSLQTLIEFIKVEPRPHGRLPAMKLDRLAGRVVGQTEAALKEATQAFGKDPNDWPTSVLANFKQMVKINDEIRNINAGVRHLLENEILPRLKAGQNEADVIQVFLQTALDQVHKSAELIKKFDKPATITFKMIRVESQKPVLEELERIKDELGGPEHEALSLLPSISHAFSESDDATKKERLCLALFDLAKIVGTKRVEETLGQPLNGEAQEIGAIERFKMEYEAVQKELSADLPAKKTIQAHALEARHQLLIVKTAIRSAKEVYETRKKQASPIQKPTPKIVRGPFTLEFKDGVLLANGRPFSAREFGNLRGNSAQERLLGRVADILVIPDAERERSADLAYGPFSERTKEAISKGKPLRRLQEVRDSILTVFDIRFGTAFLVPLSGGWLMDGASIFMPLQHGSTGARSIADSMRQTLLRFRNIRNASEGSAGFNAIAYDVPPHGSGFAGEAEEVLLSFKDMEVYMDWETKLFDYFRYLIAGAIPIMAIGRSHGAKTFLEYALRHPKGEKKLDGIIAVSPYLTPWSLPTLSSLQARMRLDPSHPEFFNPHPAGLKVSLAQEGIDSTLITNAQGEKELQIHSVDPSKNQWSHENPDQAETIRNSGTPITIIMGDDDQDYRSYPDYLEEMERLATATGSAFHVMKSKLVWREVDGEMKEVRVGGKHNQLEISQARDRDVPEEIAAVYSMVGEEAHHVISAFEERRRASRH